jgi:hypothetical protein
MKDYISVCYAFNAGDPSPAAGTMLGFEYQAKSQKDAKLKAAEMFSKTGYDSATWVGTSRLKYNDDRDDFELADKSLSDMLIGVDEWVILPGADLKEITFEDRPAPVQPSLPAVVTSPPAYKPYKPIVFPITLEVVKEARYFSHIIYNGETREEIFK